MQRAVSPLLRRLLSVAACAALAAQLAACGTTPPSHFYVLIPMSGSASESATATADPTLRVGLEAVRLPASVDRSQMVTIASRYQRRISELERWAEPLDVNVTRVVAQNLEARLGPTSVFPRPGAYAPPLDFVVSLQITAFDVVPDGECSLRARLDILDPQGDWKASRVIHGSATGESGGPTGVAEAMSTNLRTLSDAVADALQALHAAEGAAQAAPTGM